MSSVSTAFKVHYNKKLGPGPSGHLGRRTMASGGIDAPGDEHNFRDKKADHSHSRWMF